MTDLKTKTHKKKSLHVFKDFKLPPTLALPSVYNVSVSRCIHCLVQESQIQNKYCDAHTEAEKVVTPSLSFSETTEIDGKTMTITMMPSGLFVIDGYKPEPQKYSSYTYFDKKEPQPLKSCIILLPKKGQSSVFKANLKTGLMRIKKNKS